MTKRDETTTEGETIIKQKAQNETISSPWDNGKVIQRRL